MIFTLCGGHIIDIYDGCVDEGIAVVDVRHEQVAAHAADGYARVTGKPGCAVVTAGPGTTDAVTGVANAFRAESPMLLIGGQGALNQHKMGSLQDLPHVDMMTPITKFAATVPHTARAADMVSMAFRECYNGAPGPSFLEIPRDILDNSVPVDQARSRRPATTAARPEHRRPGERRDAGRSAVRREARGPARQPGLDVSRHRGRHRVRPHARHPGVHERLGPRHPAARRPAPLPPVPAVGFNNADLILIVGTPFDFRMGYGRRLPKSATVVQIDMDYRTVGKNRDIDLGLVGDPGAILAAVTQASSGRVRKADRKAWFAELRAEEEAYQKRLPGTCPTPTRSTRCGWRTRSTSSSPRTRSTSATAATSSPSPAAWCTEVTRPLDGPGPARHPRRRHPVRAGGEVRAARQGSGRLFGDGAFSLTGWDFETWSASTSRSSASSATTPR